MTTLDSRTVEQLRERLQARAAELLQELGEAQAEILPDPNADGREVTDQKDLAERAEEASLHDAEAARDHDELVAVRAALARIEAGTYGICVDCEEPIAPARLQAWPSAARCLPCQEAHEQHH